MEILNGNGPWEYTVVNTRHGGMIRGETANVSDRHRMNARDLDKS